MNTSIRAMLLTAVVCVVGTGHAEADIFTATVPGLEGVRMDYFGPAHSAPVDFGHGFTTIDKVTIAITATGHTGAAILSDPFLGSFETDVPAGLISLIRSTDGTASTFLGGVGPFTETLGTQQVNRFGSIAHLLGGRAEIFLEFDGLLSFYNIFVYDPPFVDIQSVTVTVEGTSTASMGDPTGDGFVGIEDLNLVLGGV